MPNAGSLMVSKILIVLSVISVLVLSSFMSIPISFAATSVKVTGSFSVPAGCCTSYAYANGEIAGIGSGTIYLLSVSNNDILASIPIDSPQYLLYDSVDKSVIVLENGGVSQGESVFDLVSISTTTNSIVSNVTMPLAFTNAYETQCPVCIHTPVAYDPHNDEIYLGSETCANGAYGQLCQVFVVSAKTLALINTISFASSVGNTSEVWSVVYDSTNNNIFVSASDGPIDECMCFGALVTISDSTNDIISIVSNTGSVYSILMPYYLELDTSNNLLYATDFVNEGIDVFNASANGAYITTIDPQDLYVTSFPPGLEPANYALDGNLVSGMFYAVGCTNNEGGVLGSGECGAGYPLNGSYYMISGTKTGNRVTSFSRSTQANCFDPFWSGVTKLTYVDCNSKLYVFTTSTGKLQTSLNVQGTIEVFNRDTSMLWVQSGNTVYEIGT